MRGHGKALPITTGLCFGLLLTTASAQYAERPHLAGSGLPGVDCSGRSIKNKRVRAVHSENPADGGATAYFIQKDPYLAYQLGRNLCFREFRDRDGIFSTIAHLGGPMPDGTTAKITANNQVSCSGCHNLPYGTPGGGVNFSKDSGRARNSPHYFGAGIVEMLAIQVRADLMRQVDTNQDGWISAFEGRIAGVVSSTSTRGAAQIEYGDFSLSGGAVGSPALNNIFRVWYVDARGRVVPDATSVDRVNTFGYNFNMIVWGWGQGPGRAALNPTNRAFLWDPWNAHGGLQAYDPSTSHDPDGDGVSLPTLSGAIQFPATHQAPDPGVSLDPTGSYSLDDPDGDGYLNEISAGDLDLGEWFMLNAPRPAFAGPKREFVRGAAVMKSLGCAECHVESWTIEAQDDVFAGDRRAFDLDVSWNQGAGRLEGELVDLTTKVGDAYVPNRGSFTVRAFFSDLKHHDMGEGFKEIDFGGNVNTLWRTAPLWGVGSGFPWGHDGASTTLRDVILRHDGEGAASKAAFEAAGPAVQALLIGFLRKLQLYDIESLPADIDGDGAISSAFLVAGQNTGPERFNAEWRFETPVRIQGLFVNTDGVSITSNAGTNIDAAYGQTLPFRIDSDDDGWPDVWDVAPGRTGYKDGVDN